MPGTAVNLADKLSTFSDHWSPKIVASYNGNDVQVVKVKGEFVWHAHPDTDPFAGRTLCGAEGRRALSLCRGRDAPAADRAGGNAEYRRPGNRRRQA